MELKVAEDELSLDLDWVGDEVAEREEEERKGEG